MAEVGLKFQPGSKALAYHGPLVYEAKVLKVYEEGSGVVDIGEGKTEPVLLNKIPAFLQEKDAYFLHYKGWSSKWDEWVSSERIMEFNDDNLGLSRELRNARKKTIERLDSGRSNEDKNTTQVKKKKKNVKALTLLKDTKANGPSKRRKQELKNAYEVVLPIRPRLKCILVDDWEIITRDRKLVDLDSTTPVSDILRTYLEYKKDSTTSEEYDTAKEVITGIRAYFDQGFDLRILYRFERLQYIEEINRSGPFKPSEKYGLEHLLRLVITIPSLAAQTAMNSISVNVLMKLIEDLVDFLDVNVESFASLYCNVSPQYDRLSRTQ